MAPPELTFDERGEEGDVGGLPPARRQRHPDLVQLVPQHPPAVLRLRPGRRKGKERNGGAGGDKFGDHFKIHQTYCQNFPV